MCSLRGSRSIYLWATISLLAAVLAPTILSPAAKAEVPPSPIANPFEPVYRRLLERGASAAFIVRLREDPSIQLRKRVVTKNVMNFLLAENYKQFLSKESVRKCKLFLRHYARPLRRCERLYKVPKEVITALLYVETKHGKDMGHSHVANVFMNVARSDLPEVVAESLAEARERDDAPKSPEELTKLQEKIKEAATRKADWAIDQLLALEKMEGKGVSFISLKGSFSGAFGLPQFIPTSYLSWAVDGDGDGKIDLFDPADAICSVGNYLKSNGWGSPREAKRKAIFHYNRSTEYGDTILELAKKLRHPARRLAKSDE